VGELIGDLQRRQRSSDYPDHMHYFELDGELNKTDTVGEGVSANHVQVVDLPTETATA